MKALKDFSVESDVHESIVPADVRETPINEVFVTTLDNQIGKPVPFRIWSLSPLGVDLLACEFHILQKGSTLRLEFKYGSQQSTISGIVAGITEDRDQTFYHVKFIQSSKGKIESVERRASTRWICSEDFYPTAMALNPVKFNELTYFKIRDISKEGLKLHTSIRNKYILNGMVFDCLVSFPMVAQVKMKLTIKHIRIELVQGKEILSIGAIYDNSDRLLNDAIARYLIQFSSAENPTVLKNEGFKVREFSNSVHFSYVKTKEEYEQVLSLRFEAYKLAGKTKPETTSRDMGDEFDSRSRIVIGKYKGKVVSSARLIFNRLEDKMEQEKFVKWPTELPRRDEMVEIMRVCTDPEFRRGDLLMSMFKFMAVTVAQSKRPWIVICATDNMLPLYKKIGFNEIGLSYNHPGLGGLKHNILLANFVDGMEGKTVGPVAWNLVWSEVNQYLEQYGILTPHPMTTIRLSIYRALGPFVELMYRFKTRIRS